MKRFTLGCILVAAIFFGCSKSESNMTSVNSTDKDFTAAACSDNFAEINIAQIAKARASDTAVLHLASQIISDRVQASASLKDIASRLNIAATDSMDAIQTALKSQLNELSGREFDSVFVHGQVTALDKDLSLYQNEISNGSNGELKSYASQTFPRIQAAKTMADSLATNY